MTSAVVVGGGISGLVAGLLLKKSYENVTIIEASPHFGGLLRSVQDDHGIWYDQGTHIPDLTKIDEVDDILFGDVLDQANSWHHYDHLPTGNYYKGTWNLETQTVSTLGFDDATRAKIEYDILASKKISPVMNLAEHLANRFGAFTSNLVFAPIYKKLYGQNLQLADLASNIGGGNFFMFGHERLIAFDKMRTRELKQNPTMDQKLAFHTEQEFREYFKKLAPEASGYLYPKGAKGIGAMIENIIRKAKRSGINLITSETVSKITSSRDQITSVELKEQSSTIDCDYLFWSVPPALGLMASGQETTASKATTRTSNIFHFNLDRPLRNTTSHYLWSWDNEDPIFRITLYDNFRSNNQHLISAECLTNNDDKDQLNSELIFAELIKMGIIDPETSIVSRKIQRLANTFPVPTLSFKKSSEENYNRFISSFSNLGISGRFSGKVWSQSHVLQDIHQQISNI